MVCERHPNTVIRHYDLVWFSVALRNVQHALLTKENDSYSTGHGAVGEESCLAQHAILWRPRCAGRLVGLLRVCKSSNSFHYPSIC